MRMFFTDRNIRRVFVLGLFLAILFAFRHLAVLLVFFVLFERGLGTGARLLRDRLRVPLMLGVVLQILFILGGISLLVYVGVTRIIPAVPQIRTDVEGQFLHLKGWMHLRGFDQMESLQSEHLIEKAQGYAGSVVGFLGSVGKSAVYVLMGLILAVVFLAEGAKLEAWRESMDEDGVPRILLRYFSYLCDAVSITAQLQVIVAVVNTLITLPVLLVMGLPSVPTLMAFLFSMGLIPVVGGVVSGIVMGTIAYVHKGLIGVAVFFVSTFLLHKIESYYLSPRLTARHVNLPGFVIITSLVLFEHAFGLVGLFLSFPALYIAARVRESWRDAAHEHADERAITREMEPSPAKDPVAEKNRP